LFRLYQKRILSDCRSLTRDENNSDEGRSSFQPWLQRIEVHHCLNHLKRREGKEVLTIDDDTVESLEQLHVPATADREIESMEERNRIDGVLNAMPPTLRVPLMMRDMDELL
jgi:DNA-directed RNA polymerase specialized sigma24 family protein